MDLARRVMESQEPAGHNRDGVLVVHVCQAPAQLAVDEIGESLVPDAGHAVAIYRHRRTG